MIYNSNQVANIIGVNVSTIKRWTDSGKLDPSYSFFFSSPNFCLFATFSDSGSQNLSPKIPQNFRRPSGGIDHGSIRTFKVSLKT